MYFNLVTFYSVTAHRLT